MQAIRGALSARVGPQLLLLGATVVLALAWAPSAAGASRLRFAHALGIGALGAGLALPAPAALGDSNPQALWDSYPLNAGNAKALAIERRTPIADRKTAAAKQSLPAPRGGAGVPAWVEPAVIAALVLSLAVLLTVVRPAARRARARHAEPAVRRAAAPSEDVTALAEPVTAPTVVGYLPGDSQPGSSDDEKAIAEACRERGWTVARIVREVQGASARAAGRPGLSYALDEIEKGTASRLVVHKLEHIADSLADLRTVLSWFMRAGVALTVLDVGLDTGTLEGRTSMRSLLSVCRSEWAKGAEQRRNAMGAARRVGRPGVADRPELADRIRRMRSSGMTLRAIVDTLNREGVPTIRGGAEWRPSSVQSVLGYRRTRTRDR